MLESVRRHLLVSYEPVRWVASVGVVGSFLWLLTEDLVHPLAIYLFELYLTF